MYQTKPLIIAHLLHPQHLLTLESGGSFICDGCNKPSSDGDTRYRCTTCNFDLDMACAMSSSKSSGDDIISMSSIIPSVITDNFRHHNHPLILLSGQNPYRCNGCGKISPRGGTRYHCMTCDFDLDWSCAIFSIISFDHLNESSSSNVPSNAPSVITNHFRHPKHSLTLQSGQNSYNCDGCGEKSLDGGTRYRCTDCDFDLDMACAMSEPKFIDEQIENMSFSNILPQVITYHSRHELHPLTLQRLNNFYHCDSCGEVRLGGGIVYGCKRCNFALDWFCALSSHPVCFECECESERSQNKNQNQNQREIHENNKHGIKSSRAYRIGKRVVKSAALHYTLHIIGDLIG